METKRFELGEGGFLRKGPYAEFYVEMKHGTAAAVANITREYLSFPGGDSKVTVTQEEKDGPLKVEGKINKIDIDIGKMDFNASNEIIILKQVSKWSFGEVTAEVLADLPETMFDKLKAIADKLYGQVPLVKSDAAN